MDKRKIDEVNSGVKRRRKVLTLDSKLEIIKRHERGESKAKIGRDLGMNESTVRAILKKIDDYKEKGKVASTLGLQTTRNRSRIMIEMEHLLSLWIEDCNLKQIPLNTMTIKMKALNIFSAIKRNLTKENEILTAAEMKETFTASSGWFERFKTRTGIHNVRITGEAGCVDKYTRDKDPNTFKKIIEERDYDDKQLFNTDEMNLYWVKMPSKTFLIKKENIQKSQPLLGFDEKDDRNDEDLFEPHSKELSDDELLNLDRECVYKKAVGQAGDKEEQQNIEISVKGLDTMFQEFEKFKQLIMDIDPNIERRTKVQQNLDNVLSCYKQIHAEKTKENNKNGTQMTLDKYFSKK
ncbi:transposable element-derived 1-like [Octopus vulgaris]|uniref:Transposable element-derived 1-like n=1 Tax=Octopus vulgaris TaxID=6645 RepID=A0AA36EXM3_OCTVU|nr:transposable element-derived 1-like [Octopus vulgaris]